MPKRKPLILLIVNILIIIPFLIVCLVPFMIHSASSWFVSMVGMGFPYLLGIMVILLVVWIFKLNRSLAKLMIIINIVVLLLGYQQIRAVMGFHFFSNKDYIERPVGIRVMSWNVSGWDIHNWDKKNHHTYQPVMFDLIEQSNPDVLLLQEFFNCIDPDIVVSYVGLLSQRGYPYYFFSPQSITVSGKFQSGLAIFSKYPLSDTAFFFPESAGHSEGFQHADITINNKKIRFFNTHLESAGMDSDDIQAVGKIKGSRTIFNKLKFSHNIRMKQAEMLKQNMNKSPYPVVLGGDVGDLPNTTIYFYLRKNMQDAFTKKGSGIGRTFAYVAPNLRIDYLFFSPEFEVKQFNVIKKEYSVHYPVISDISE